MDVNQKLLEELWKFKRSSPDDLRSKGMTVVSHSDFQRDGESRTYWLLTIERDRQTLSFRAEGSTDQEALDQIRAKWAAVVDDYHHAPMCPANHYHGTRAPTGKCSCGAVKHNIKAKRA